jgi:hypothetical protein
VAGRGHPDDRGGAPHREQGGDRHPRPASPGTAPGAGKEGPGASVRIRRGLIQAVRAVRREAIEDRIAEDKVAKDGFARNIPVMFRIVIGGIVIGGAVRGGAVRGAGALFPVSLRTDQSLHPPPRDRSSSLECSE